ncbi:fungal specific transcription factor [Hirsutella rhossiliensis]|uniref:Fungal specific transcription factor domain-containing protein n=1 Tax=Hirsutella rhossiliensis TaxID=111463 RepID=A0A9P8N6D8_9HYPO|nr:fungal specific transcription factor domain-containing protein [Hirsutella rhossiliensis]KAH0967660.1 fungal specific transcription factor domain-containing protein [Hirsutella rhossiliensis]
MPGILPMKVIKVGNSAQSRIAQCANVGFECRTSDKLSRRAFPRGYTESLEERVRQLEAEVRELKDLLDEKDEKIDMLSAMEDSFRVQAPPLLLGVENSDSWFMGPSSGRSLITSLKRKLQEAGKPCTDFNPDAFLHVQGCPPLTTQEPDQSSRIPPRLFSDRCVNVFFQEWAPLFPVVHKPTFLRIYEEFVASPEKVKCNYKLAQLHLVYSIAGLSSESPDHRQVAACEKQWTRALEALLFQNSMNTLQCLILALLYCTMRGDHQRLQHYKSIAVGLSHRLGLHQSQRRFSFGALTLETRKKVFWTLYTLDCFTAATMGLPKLLKEDMVETEYPSDTDDEYITEKGFQPTLPGESTRLSSALALFRASRILARVLENLYPTSTNHDLSLQKLRMLEGELDAWYAELPTHLRLNFVQDKPSTDVTGSRSPLLALTFYYIRTLIYRPAVGSTLGPRAAPALLSIAESSKHMIQITQLLEQRSMSFSFCLNKSDLLAVCGATLLYQMADLKQDSKLTREVGRLISVVIRTLVGAKAPGSLDLERVARSLVSVDTGTNSLTTPTRQGSMPAPSCPAAPLSRAMSNNSGFQHCLAGGGHGLQAQDKARRMTMPFVSAQGVEVHRARSRPSFDSVSPRDKTGMSNADSYRLSMAQPSRAASRSIPNLDYLSLNNTPSQTQPPSPTELARMQAAGSVRSQVEQMLTGGGEGTGKMSCVSTSDWEALLGSMDGGLNNVYDAIYGGASLISEASLPGNHTPHVNDWSPDSWDLSNFSLGELGRGGRGAPQSVLSTSDESLSSGEEVAPSELGLSVGSVEYHKHLGRSGSGDSFGTDGGEGFPL